MGRQGQLLKKASHELKDEEFAKKEKSVLGRGFAWAMAQSRRQWRVLETWSGLLLLYHKVCGGTVKRCGWGPTMHTSV